VPIHKRGDKRGVWELQWNSNRKCSLQNSVEYNIGKN
jgi:hypothetical protein